MNNNYNAQFWSNEIRKWSIKYTGYSVNVYSNSRKREVVYYRALHIYMLHKYLKWGKTYIRDFYISNGKSKSFNHASIIHSLKSFDIYKRYDPNLLECLLVMTRCYTTQENKLNILMTKINYIDPIFYTELQPCIEEAFEKSIKLNEELIKLRRDDE